MEHPDQAPASTLTVRTPQCRHTVWGKKCLKHSFHLKPEGIAINLGSIAINLGLFFCMCLGPCRSNTYIYIC